MPDDASAAADGTAGVERSARARLLTLAAEVLQAPVDPALSLIAQGLDSLGAADLVEALQAQGRHADYGDLLGGASVETLAASRRAAAPDGPTAGGDPAQPAPLTGPQAACGDLDRRAWGSWPNISLCLSMPAAAIPAAFLPAMLQSLCDAHDAMRLRLESVPDVPGVLKQRAIEGFQLPLRMIGAPPDEARAMRLVEAFEGEEASPFGPSARALILASAGPEGRHWLCLTLRVLARRLREMIAARALRVEAPPALGYLDYARRRAAAADAPQAGEARRALRGLLSGADASIRRPAPRLADEGLLDLGDLPVVATLRPAEHAALEALATRLETTTPLLLHALFSVLAARLTGDAGAAAGERDLLACHVAANRERHAGLRDLVGCLDASIPVAVRLREGETLASLSRRRREAFAQAHALAADLPRGGWLDAEGQDAEDAPAALFERMPHINIVRAESPGAEAPAPRSRAPGTEVGDRHRALDLQAHVVRRPQRPRWGLLLRAALPAADASGMAATRPPACA